jgi:hypothetical protein
MTKRYQASMVALCTMETETKQVLDGSGIDTMYIVFYLDFARQLFKLSHGRDISGPTLAKETPVLPEKWQNRSGDTSAARRAESGTDPRRVLRRRPADLTPLRLRKAASRRSVDVSPSASPCRHPL